MPLAQTPEQMSNQSPKRSCPSQLRFWCSPMEMIYLNGMGHSYMNMLTRRKKIILGIGALIFLICSIGILLSVGFEYALQTEFFPKIDTRQKEQTDMKPDHLVPVKRVVDGDTIVVTIQNQEKTIRLIGINTPETVDPRRQVECFGREASTKMKELVQGKEIQLKEDPTQENEDKYGRLLRYAFLEDGTLVNQAMIEDGYAYEYTYQKPYQYQDQFKRAQQEAKASRKGLWAPDTCDGKK